MLMLMLMLVLVLILIIEVAFLANISRNMSTSVSRGMK